MSDRVSVDHKTRRTVSAHTFRVKMSCASMKNQTLSCLLEQADEKLILLAIKRAFFTWQQRNASDDLRIKIQHFRLQEEQSKQDNVSRGRTVKMKGVYLLMNAQ